MRHKGMPASHYCGGGIHPDNDTWWLRVWFKPVPGYGDSNMASFFVQMTADEAFLSFSKMIARAKRNGEIKDYALQHIEKFWTVKEFERKVMRRVRKKK